MQNMPSRKQIALVCMRPSNSLFASIIRREGNLHSAIVHSLFLVWGLLYSTRRYGIFQETSKNFHMKKLDFNPLTQGRFSDPYFKVLWEGGKTKFLDFFFIRASATKRFARSRIFKYGCLVIILRNRQKEREGGSTAPPPMA